MNAHREDLNVILLSHRGAESCPWVTKGRSGSNEVCPGPVGNAVSRRSFLTPPGSRTARLSAGIRLTAAMKHVDHKTLFSLVILILPL